MIEIFIDFYKVKISNPFYSKIPRLIFTKLFRQLKIYPNFDNQLKNLLYVRSWVKIQFFTRWVTLTPFSVLLFLFLKIIWMGCLTHCLIRINWGLTHCLVSKFSSVLGGVYNSLVDYGGNFSGEKVVFVSFTFVL